MEIKHFKDYINGLNEGLIKSHLGELVLKNIIEQLKYLHLNVNGHIDNDKLILILNNFHLIPLNQIENIFNIIEIHIINRGGWFPSTTIIL